MNTIVMASDLVDLKKCLSSNEYQFIRRIGGYADEFGINVYLVGGFVRDLFLGKKDIDTDITVEGDGVKFTEFLAKKLNAPFKCFEKFRTGKIFLKNKLNIDITSARSEYYEYPASLPLINFSEIQKDLYRRDFTINAMAIQINKKNFGKFIDFFNGYNDLKHKIIRILHDNSFIDDPTRILRAIRFEQRFGFKIEKNTLNLLRKTINNNLFEKLPGERLRDEILLVLKEKNVYKILKKGKTLGIWDVIYKGLKFNNEILNIFKNLYIYSKKNVFNNIDMDCVFMMIFFSSLNTRQTYDIMERLKLKNEWKNKIYNVKKYEKNILKQIKKIKRDKKKIFVLLNIFKREELFYFTLVHGKIVYDVIEKQLKIYNNIKLQITGDDLKKFGIKEGPVYSKILLEILLEKIDGKIKTKKQEIEYVKNKLQGGKYGHI